MSVPADQPVHLPGYRIVRILGRGGMATVYLAVQESLGREVALKLLAPKLAEDPIAAERFIREARTAAQLEHHHIVGVHDVGKHEGQPYLSMEYMPRDSIAGGAMSPAEALQVVREIALALKHAHEKGVVHRDVKPENILRRNDGSCALADFGIARTTAPGMSLTQEGMAVGTPHYMSPEQVQGLTLDGRSDLYSLGVVLYELLTGELPYRGTDGWNVGMQHISAPRPKLPPSLQRFQPLVDSLLAKDPVDRPQSGADVARRIDDALAALTPTNPTTVVMPTATPVSPVKSRRNILLVTLASLALLTTVAWYWSQHSQPNPVQPESTAAIADVLPAAQTGVTLAVLPFANLSGDPSQDYFSDGLTEEILNQLSRIPALRLTGRTSSFSFKGRNEDLRQIGAKLGVEHLLEGSVRKDGEQLRVTAQLVRAKDGTQQWSKTYNRHLSGLFAVQDEIAKDVAQALSVKLDVVTLNSAQGGTTNVAAYDGYLRWRDFQLSERRDPAETRRMIQQLREAVALDPGFVLAWDGLAQSLTELAEDAQPAEAIRLRSEVAAAHARVVALAPDSWIVQRERAYSLFAEGKWAEAIAVAKAIMDSSPKSWEHTYPYINLIFAVGRLEETARIVDELRAVEPLAMFVSRDQQWNLTALRRYDDAEVEYQRSKTLAGSYAEPEYNRFLRLLSQKDTDPQALRDQYRLLQDGSDRILARYLRELAPVIDDRPGMLNVLRKEYAAQPSQGIAKTADALGDADLALASLRSTRKTRSTDYHDYWELWIAPYSELRTLPGYKALMRETGLIDYWHQTGEWGDACRPVGKDDFECK